MSDDRFDFMILIGAYLKQRLDPFKHGVTFTHTSSARETGVSRDTFDRLFPLIQPIIDDYVEKGTRATTDQQLDDLARQTAQRITDTYSTIAPGESIDPGSASYFESTSYSDLPVLLLYYLGVIDTAVYYLGQSYLYYAPNEWRALIKAGLNLCEYNGDYPYLYYLIKSIYLIHPERTPIYKQWEPLQSQSQERLPYNSQDLMDTLSSAIKRGECTLTEKDLRNLQNAYREAEEKYQRSLEETEREHIIWKTYMASRGDRHYTDEEIEGLSIMVGLRKSNTEKRSLLDAINQVLPIIERSTKSRAISGALAELGPFSRFPGGEQYRIGHEVAREEFATYGGSGVDITQRLQAIRQNPNVTWDQLIPIAVDLGILSSSDPRDLQDLIIEEVDRLIMEIPSAKPNRIAQIADLFALDQPIDRDALLDYLEQWGDNIQTVTDWPTLLQSAQALSIFTLPYERLAFRNYLLDFASQL